MDNKYNQQNKLGYNYNSKYKATKQKKQQKTNNKKLVN